MSNSNLKRSILVILIGAITTVFWLPLLPIGVPLVALFLVGKWVVAHLFQDSSQKIVNSGSNHLYFPINHVPHHQALPTAWSTLANLPSPARADSLPSLIELKRKDSKSYRRQVRDERKRIRALNGLELRRQVPGF